MKLRQKSRLCSVTIVTVLCQTASLTPRASGASFLDSAKTRGTSEVVPAGVLPRLTITSPDPGAVLPAWRVDVRGLFTSPALKQIRVNGALARANGGRFEAPNVPLQPGTNLIEAVAEDAVGSTSTNSVLVTVAIQAAALTNDPVSIHISPAGGFAPLEISVLPKMAIPAKLVRVLYDFDGDGIIDQTNTDLRLIRHTYTRAGDYYPMITAGYYGPKLASKLEGLSRSLTHVFSERTSVSAFSLTGSTREAARV